MMPILGAISSALWMLRVWSWVSLSAVAIFFVARKLPVNYKRDAFVAFRSFSTWNLVSVASSALKFALCVVHLAIIQEGTIFFTTPGFQPLFGILLIILGILGIALHAVKISDIIPKSGEFVGEYLVHWCLALVQATVLMKFNGPHAINLVWITFAEAQIGMAIWTVLVLRLDDTLWKTLKQLGVIAQTKCLLPSRSRLSLAIIGMVCFALWHSFLISPWNNTFKNDERYISSRIITSYDSYDASRRAAEYYQSQIPHIEMSLKKRFTLHPYFARTELREGMRLEEIVLQRLKSFEIQLHENNATGYMMEKDKCAMLNFFQNHDINIPKVIGIYHDKEELLEKLYEIQKSSTAYNYPLFLKGCHLTQGGDRGTRPARAKNFTSHLMEKYLLTWVEKKWAQKALDNNRPWSTLMNKLLARLEPGIAIQAPFRGLRISPDNTPLEVKVEVVWGRAYLGLFPEYHDVIALRGGIFEYTDRSQDAPEHWTLGNKPDIRLKWLLDKGHMEAVWELAEKVALRIGIDEIRVDVFIDPERPESPAVNEISLSSGHNYLFHSPHLAAAWVGPHLSLSPFNSMTPSLSSRSGMTWSKPEVRKTNAQVHLQTPVGMAA
eukprot:CAMPEP_0114512096 /NCGR_PEP_ID=MMETSP0109-20121206/14776_1 /TAXON_ID=29199 /ORGANISM="Chlorarachnion reptans, Strain CCCM449" /LENGTH=607 /DNA_ID=CAMNT_0001691723 /DNA_START=40 /DNA_END=1863 /DNA_ORIENTATION=-